VARVVVTPSADADTAEIIADLKAKAGFVVAAATMPLLSGSTTFSPTFPARVRHAPP
jgi:hypothetical protein